MKQKNKTIALVRYRVLFISLVIWITSNSPVACAQTPANSRDFCLRTSDLEPNKTYTLATLASNEWNWWASAVVNFAGRVSTQDGSNSFADVWLLHTDLFRWGVNEDLANARGPIFIVKERESFWGKGGVEVRVRTRNSATKVCLCTANDADKLPNEKCLKQLAAAT
jgi:hypothetical protein